MKKLMFLAIITGFSSVFSQESTQDPKAKVILDELSAKTRAYKSIKAEFALTLEDREHKKETQTGLVQIKGEKYKLEIKGQDVISDGKTVWTYLKDAKEVQINNVDAESKDAVNPSNIFTMYETGFKYKFDKEETFNGKKVQTIDLYPSIPDKKKYHTVKLMVDKVKKQIAGVKMLMKDGSTQLYSIKTFSPNGDMKDALFVFDAKTHPGVEIVDLRE